MRLYWNQVTETRNKQQNGNIYIQNCTSGPPNPTQHIKPRNNDVAILLAEI